MFMLKGSLPALHVVKFSFPPHFSPFLCPVPPRFEDSSAFLHLT